MMSKRRLISTDRIILLLSTVGLVVFAIFLVRYNRSDFSGTPVNQKIGKIATVVGDTRYRMHNSYGWTEALGQQDIHWGDSIFSSRQSQAIASLDDGNTVVIGENSLVVFAQEQGRFFFDLRKGNYKMKVNGEVQVILNSTKRVIKGTEATVQIYVPEEGKPLLKLLEGSASVAHSPEEPAEILEVEKTVVVNLPEQERIPTSEPEEVASSPQNYYYKLYDLYDYNNGQLFEKMAPPPPGGLYLEDGPPQLLSHPTGLVLKDKNVSTALELRPGSLVAGYVVQASTDPQFARERTISFWQSHSLLPLTFTKPGKFYYRFRAVNTEQVISDWSQVAHFEVQKEIPAPVKSAEPQLMLSEEPSQPKRAVAALEPAETMPEPKVSATIEQTAPKKKKGLSLKVAQKSSSLEFTQNNSALAEDGSFSSVGYSGYGLELGYEINPNYFVFLSYFATPIQVSNNQSLTIDRTLLSLTDLALSLQANLGNKADIDFALQASVGNKRLPFLAAGTVTDLSLLEYRMNYVSLGLLGTQSLSTQWQAAYYGSALRPLSVRLSSSEDFSLSDGLGMILGVGLKYRLLENISLGLDLSYQNTNIKYNYTPTGLSKSAGEQKINDSSVLIGIQGEI